MRHFVFFCLVKLLPGIEAEPYGILTSTCFRFTLRCIANVLNHHDTLSHGSDRPEQKWPVSAFITHLVYLKQTDVVVDESAISVSAFPSVGSCGDNINTN